ncbi:hypothetical protein LSTR_LSTR000994 [Laodelphax striatellus]|uniref:C2H2-type domain-containing protein n=1 Tax=Laodelphax striatellus TaxID=195883 RepID=A0A482X159_LAOST|nr:hypothetical protein LSTR_LSTR000994 [Laodelphax striatellus]
MNSFMDDYSSCSWSNAQLADCSGGSDKRHSCPKCGKTYKHRRSLWLHSRYECGVQASFQCPLCSKRFMDDYSSCSWSNAQLADCSGGSDKRHSCPKCGKTYKHRRSLWLHSRYECGVQASFQCQKNVDPMNSFMDDYSSCSWSNSQSADCSDNRHSCAKCGKTYKHRRSLALHSRYECGVEAGFQCNREFFQQLATGGDRNFVCNTCGRGYKRKSGFIQHLRYQCGVEPQFTCQFCPHKSRFKSHMKMHLASRHRDYIFERDYASGKFRCPKCGRLYSTPYILKSHLKFECGVEPQFRCPCYQFLVIGKDSASGKYACPKCGNLYSKGSSVRTHLKYECGVEPKFSCGEGSEVKRHRCEGCGRHYRWKRGLFQHQKYECGKDPIFSCCFCPFRSKRREGLKAHKLKKHFDIIKLSLEYVADEDRRYECETCGKRYRWKAGLAQHQKYECGTDPKFSCMHCSFKSRRRNGLKLHLINKHQDPSLLGHV